MTCLDCSNIISIYAKRCSICNSKYLWKIGKIIRKPRKWYYILTKKFLIKEYINTNKTMADIGKEIGCHFSTVRKYIIKFHLLVKIPIQKQKGRKISEYQKRLLSIKYRGSGNPNWKNGISKLPYSFKFDNNLKLFIRTRDNFICQCCHLKEEDHYRGDTKLNLHIHHIDYNKLNCNSCNLITLCYKCNSRANGNRDYWFAYYIYIIEDKLCMRN